MAVQKNKKARVCDMTGPGRQTESASRDRSPDSPRSPPYHLSGPAVKSRKQSTVRGGRKESGRRGTRYQERGCTVHRELSTNVTVHADMWAARVSHLRHPEPKPY